MEHVQKIFQLLGDDAATAKKNADTVMRMETELAKSHLTRVQRRDPYKLKHKMKLAELEALAPNFDWKAYFGKAQYPPFKILNVATPDFFKEMNTLLASTPLADWKTYLRFHVANSSSPYLSETSCRKISISTASIFAARKRSSPAGNAVSNTRTIIWMKRSARPMCQSFLSGAEAKHARHGPAHRRMRWNSALARSTG